MRTLSKHRFHLLAAGLLIVAVTLVYLNCLTNEFVWDDKFLIEKNSYIQSWQNLPTVFTSHLFEASGSPSMSYRPLQSLTYILDYSIWGLNPVGYHLTNIIFHLFCTVILYASLNLLLHNNHMALVSALLFGIHPIHTEAVTYVAGRADPLMGTFFLSGFCMFILFRTRQGRQGWLFLVGFVLMFVLSILSKAYGAFLILALLLYDVYHRPDQDIAKIILPYLLVTLVIAGYVWVRGNIDFPVAQMELSSASPPPFTDRILTFPKVLAVYMGLLIMPLHLQMQRAMPLSRVPFDIYIIGAFGILFLLIYAIVRTYKRQKMVSFGLGWFLLMIFPLSDTIYPLNASMAEHWLFIPSIGFITAAVAFVWNMTGKEWSVRTHVFDRRLRLLLFSVFIIFFGARTVMRNRDWKDEFTIWSQTAAYPTNASVHGNLAVAYWRKGNVDRAIEELRHAIRLQNNYPEAHYNLGYIYMSQGKQQLAKKEFQEAIRYRPDYKKALMKLRELTR